MEEPTEKFQILGKYRKGDKELQLQQQQEQQKNEPQRQQGAMTQQAGTELSTLSSSLENNNYKILLGVTGSVAAVKAPELAVCLCRHLDNVNIKILLTTGARNFWEQSRAYNEYWWAELQRELLVDNNTTSPTTQTNTKADGTCATTTTTEHQGWSRIEILHSEDEWRSWNQLGDPVMHIELRDWADCLVMAPLSAHTLAKLANGLCDDALSSVARAWDFERKSMILAPAMNTYMWQHPLTRRQLDTVQGFFGCGGGCDEEANATASNKSDDASKLQPSSNKRRKSTPMPSCRIIQPRVKTLACGQVGNGALAPVSDIVEAVLKVLDPYY